MTELVNFRGAGQHLQAAAAAGCVEAISVEGAQFTCFTGTKVQILTHFSRCSDHRPYNHPAVYAEDQERFAEDEMLYAQRVLISLLLSLPPSLSHTHTHLPPSSLSSLGRGVVCCCGLFLFSIFEVWVPCDCRVMHWPHTHTACDGLASQAHSV